MGCGGSKQDDKTRTRVQQPPSTPSTKGSQQAATPGSQNSGNQTSQSTPMSTGKKQDGGNEGMGQSYTDMRIKERELFQSIINRTAQNFIDISQSPGIVGNIEEGDVENEEIVPNSQFGNKKLPEELIGLPAISSETQHNLKKVIEQSDVTNEEIQTFVDLCSKVCQIHGSMKLNEQNVGQLVVTLPDIEAT